MPQQNTSAWLMDERALALALLISQRTFETILSRGEGPPFIRLGRQRRWRPEDVDAWIKARQAVTTVARFKKSPSNVVAATSAIQEWKRQVAGAHVYDTMTPDEKSAERELMTQAEPASNKRQKFVRIKRNAVTKQSLLAALEQI